MASICSSRPITSSGLERPDSHKYVPMTNSTRVAHQGMGTECGVLPVWRRWSECGIQA